MIVNMFAYSGYPKSITVSKMSTIKTRTLPTPPNRPHNPPTTQQDPPNTPPTPTPTPPPTPTQPPTTHQDQISNDNVVTEEIPAPQGN